MCDKRAGKQFTFKTTRDTWWLREILENIPDRSDFVREMIIKGMEYKGYITWKGRTPVVFMKGVEHLATPIAWRDEWYSTEQLVQEQSHLGEDLLKDPSDKREDPQKDHRKFLREHELSDSPKDKTSPPESTQNLVEKMDSLLPIAPPIIGVLEGEEVLDLNAKLNSLFDDD